MPHQRIVALDETSIDLVYPLVRTAAPEVSLNQWRRYARRILRRGGLLGLLGPDDSLLGFLTFTREMTLRQGAVLRVDHLIAFSLSRQDSGRRALRDAAEEIARKEGCSVLELRVRNPAADGPTYQSRGWPGPGHRIEGIVLRKHLDHGTPGAAARA